MLGLGNTLSGGIVPAAEVDLTNNYSVSFDGTDDWITMGDVTILDDSNTFTISTWFNIDTFPIGVNKIVFVSKDDAYELYMKMVSHENNNSSLYLRLNNGAVNTSDTLTLSTDTWYHLAAVHTSDGTTIYLDGDPVGTGL